MARIEYDLFFTVGVNERAAESVDHCQRLVKRYQPGLRVPVFVMWDEF